MAAERPDLIIVGGGLAGGLAALAMRQERPGARVVLVEAGERIGGNHLWSFFGGDVAAADRALVAPLIGHRWPGYSVRFPAYERAIDQPYSTIESEALDAAVRFSGVEIIRDQATEMTPTQVVLSDGRKLEASAVLDARGLTTSPDGLNCGWQKFVGQLLDIPSGHGVAEPVVMDATVAQRDGYRFVYLLPFSPTRLFVEDTYYSDDPALPDDLAERIGAYACDRGWRFEGVTREEKGVLPVVTGGDFDAFWLASDTLARAGVRAGLFHPLTSYSLPDAVRFAAWLARSATLDEELGAATRAYAQAHWRRGGFDRMLARMLMRAAEPDQRYRVLERFYRLPSPLIARFYAGQSTFLDRLRILAGRPPVSVARAIRAVREGA